jgi:poly(hydroxyalkanoate) depolymerase family esterase
MTPNYRPAFFRNAANKALAPAAATTPLLPLRDFGTNPGNLAAHVYRPANMQPDAPLVVVLHGCTQTAAGYDRGSGWSALAEANGFAVLYPEQRRANNPNLCFSWFVPEHIRRGGGEAESIRQMIVRTVADHAIDPDRVYITGLSAGGAMTAVMLAAYPELFAGGAIVGGLPYGAARSLPDALAQMRGRPPAADLTAAVHGAAPRPLRMPTVSIWHGSDDRTVHVENASATLDQWLGVHGLDAADGEEELVAGHRRRVWRDAAGREVVESYTVSGMGHGTPLDTSGGCGVAGPFMLEAGISSTERIAAFWAIGDAAAVRPPCPERQQAAAANDLPPASPMHPTAVGHSDVRRIIEHALRTAGLMK